MIYRNYDIDCAANNNIIIPVSHQEHGKIIYTFNPYNSIGRLSLTDCTKAVYVGKKQDGHIIANECKINDGTIMLGLTLQMTSCVGELNGALILYFPDGNIQFRDINFNIIYTPHTDNISSTDEFTVLENSIKQIEKIIAEGIETSQGKSAYEIAVEKGFEGTVEEWLESLNGTDGRGITSTEINANGELVLTYSDGSATNVGVVVGTKGEKGDKGDTGEPGTAGADGQDYILTDSDKTDIANIVINEYDSSMMTILGGDSDVSD